MSDYNITIKLAKICLENNGQCPVQSGADYMLCKDCYFYLACKDDSSPWTESKFQIRRDKRISMSKRIHSVEALKGVLNDG